MLRPLSAALVTAAFMAAGCASDDQDRVVQGGILAIYAGVPLEGPDAPHGIGIMEGAKLALAEADGEAGDFRVVATYLGNTRGSPARPDRVQAARNARRAAQDARTIGYIGDLESVATRVSLAISNQAGIAHVSPGATGVELTRGVEGAPPGAPERFYPTGERTFARVIPDDEMQATAAARWARERGGRRFWVAGSLTTGYPRIVGSLFSEAAEEIGMREVGKDPARGGSLRTAEAQADVIARSGNPDVIFFANDAPDDRLAELVRAVARRLPDAELFGTRTLLDPRFVKQLGSAGRRMRITSPALPASELPETGAAFARRYEAEFGRAPDPYAAYGYEAMALMLDAIEGAGEDGDDRDAVIDELLATRRRSSVLGRYSLTGDGDTTLERIAGYRVAGGRAVFDRVLNGGPNG